MKKIALFALLLLAGCEPAYTNKVEFHNSMQGNGVGVISINSTARLRNKKEIAQYIKSLEGIILELKVIEEQQLGETNEN